jgi:hypothetical protein
VGLQAATWAKVLITFCVWSPSGAAPILDDNSFSIGGGWLAQSTTKWVSLYTVTLQSGKSYRFLAVGDADAKDVDLEVLDATGESVASDTATAPEASVDFRPETTQQYKVRVRLYARARTCPACAWRSFCPSNVRRRLPRSAFRDKWGGERARDIDSPEGHQEQEETEVTENDSMKG